jgi:carboxylesterase
MAGIAMTQMSSEAPSPSTNGSNTEAFSSKGSGARARIGVALIHGFTGSPASLRPLGELLAKRGFAVEVPRLPGHGTTWRDMLRTRYDDWRAEVVRTAGDLKSRTETLVMVGLSMGGTLVLDTVSSGDAGADGAVSINAQILNREGIVVKLGPYLEKILPVVPARAAGLTRNDIAKPGVAERAYGWVPSAAGNSLVRALPRVRGQLSRVTCPTIIMYSRQDHSVPPANSQALLKLVPGAEELVLERSYHVATLDYDLELIEERVTAFADRIATRGRA